MLTGSFLLVTCFSDCWDSSEFWLTENKLRVENPGGILLHWLHILKPCHYFGGYKAGVAHPSSCHFVRSMVVFSLFLLVVGLVFLLAVVLVFFLAVVLVFLLVVVLVLVFLLVVVLVFLLVAVLVFLLVVVFVLSLVVEEKGVTRYQFLFFLLLVEEGGGASILASSEDIVLSFVLFCYKSRRGEMDDDILALGIGTGIQDGKN